MRIPEVCAQCLYDRQRHRSDDPAYLAEVRRIIDSRSEEDSAPYLVYLFQKEFFRRFGGVPSYREVKRKYNDLVLAMEEPLRARIEDSDDPLTASLLYARIGNYIDFGAMDSVDEQTFLALFDDARPSEADLPVMASFFRRCAGAKRFLLIADNSGEIVLDKLFLEQLKKRFPTLDVAVMVRGAEVLNDVTAEDAEYTGLSDMAEIVSNGADVILAKGQGNYETLSPLGKNVFYSLLCKCDVFVDKFRVPRFTGLFLEEGVPLPEQI